MAAPLSRHAHAVYLAGHDRAAALAELCDRVRPGAVVALADDHGLAGFPGQAGHTQVTHDSVSVLERTAAAPEDADHGPRGEPAGTT